MPVCEVTLQSTYGTERFCVLFRREFDISSDEITNEMSLIPEDCEMGSQIIQAIKNNVKTFVCAGSTFRITRQRIILDATGNNPYFKRHIDFTTRKHPPVVYVYRQDAICPTCRARHIPQSVENVTASMITMSGMKIDNINLQFCRNCKRYFIDLQSLRQYNRTFGALFFERDLDGVSDLYNWDFAADSVLSRHGYTANGSMSAADRQRCITMIIENNFATKSEIIHRLSRLIDLNGARCAYGCLRWEEDLKFLNNYNIESQRFVGEITELRNSRGKSMKV